MAYDKRVELWQRKHKSFIELKNPKTHCFRVLETMEAWDRLAGAKAVGDSGIDRLPQFYIKPQEQRPKSDSWTNLRELDLIDISALGGTDQQLHDSIISQLKQASENYGFFQVVNHGVDSELMQKIHDLAEDFFTLPLEEKMKLYSADVNVPVKYGTSFNPLKEAVLDWSDNIQHRLFMPKGPEDHPWPLKPSAYRELATEYLRQVSALAKRLLSALSESLGLKPNHLQEAFQEDHAVTFRINYYPPCPEPELAIGSSGHSDIGGLTLLLPSEGIPGLQVKIQGEWRTIKPVPGAFVVNICDQLQIFTNGRYKSCEHRAIVNSEKARISVGVFWDPALSCMVAPIPELLSDGETPLYHPCTYEDYIAKLYSRELIGKEWIDSQKVTK